MTDRKSGKFVISVPVDKSKVSHTSKRLISDQVTLAGREKLADGCCPLPPRDQYTRQSVTGSLADMSDCHCVSWRQLASPLSTDIKSTELNVYFKQVKRLTFMWSGVYMSVKIAICNQNFFYVTTLYFFAPLYLSRAHAYNNCFSQIVLFSPFFNIKKLEKIPFTTAAQTPVIMFYSISTSEQLVQ